MGIFGTKKNLFACADCSSERIHELQEEINTLQDEVTELQSLILTVPLTQKISLSYSDIQTLYTTPKLLIANPGAGKAIMVLNAAFAYTFSGAGYNMTGITGLIVTPTSQVVVNNSTAQLIIPAVGLGGTENRSGVLIPSLVSNVGGYLALKANDSLSLKVYGTANPSGGGGSLDVYLTYQIITL
jgi:hypothetical protein